MDFKVAVPAPGRPAARAPTIWISKLPARAPGARPPGRPGADDLDFKVAGAVARPGAGT